MLVPEEPGSSSMPRRREPVSYAIITERLNDPQDNEPLVYSTRAAAERALQQYLAYLQAAGATIEGDLTSGYVARWQDRGHLVSMRLTIGQVQ